MSNPCAVTVPLSRIGRIQIYVNTRRRTLTQIMRETGADYGLNGTLYNMRTLAVNCHLKAEGALLCDPGYKAWGYAWDRGEDLHLALLPASAEKSYIACTLLARDGKAESKLYYDSGQGGKRGRSAIGIKGDRLALYCSRDGSAAARTPEGLRNDLVKAGWDSAVMLDSGGSSQCDFQGQRITSSRRVQHYILVYLNDNEPEGGKPMVEINAYSKAKDGGKRLSTNFKVSEFACSDGSDAVLVAPRLVMVLQSIRSHFAAPVTIHSAYRTPQYNTKVGGVAHSQHGYGTAADISVKGKTPAQVAAYAREIMPDWGGVGIYAKQGFTHIDVREDKTDWTG